MARREQGLGVGNVILGMPSVPLAPHQHYYAQLPPQIKELIFFRHALYDGSWDDLITDGEAKQKGQPFIFDIAPVFEPTGMSLDQVLGWAQSLKEYEQHNSVTFVPTIPEDIDLALPVDYVPGRNEFDMRIMRAVLSADLSRLVDCNPVLPYKVTIEPIRGLGTTRQVIESFDPMFLIKALVESDAIFPQNRRYGPYLGQINAPFWLTHRQCELMVWEYLKLAHQDIAKYFWDVTVRDVEQSRATSTTSVANRRHREGDPKTFFGLFDTKKGSLADLTLADVEYFERFYWNDRFSVRVRSIMYSLTKRLEDAGLIMRHGKHYFAHKTYVELNILGGVNVHL